MLSWLRSLAELLGYEPTLAPQSTARPSTASSRRGTTSAPRLRGSATRRLLELRKREMRLRIKGCRVRRWKGMWMSLVRRWRAVCRSLALDFSCCHAHHSVGAATLQAMAQKFRDLADRFSQPPANVCCIDCVRTRQRLAASFQAMATWNEAWEPICTLRLQALEQACSSPRGSHFRRGPCRVWTCSFPRGCRRTCTINTATTAALPARRSLTRCAHGLCVW